MKKLIAILASVLAFSMANASSLKIATTVSASVDKVGNFDRPGLLFKFELPAELQKARIDLAYLRFRIQTDTTQKPLGLLVRPMLVPWAPGLQLPILPDSLASVPYTDVGRISFKSGKGQVEITQSVQAWQTGKLLNLGFLVFPAAEKANPLQLRSLPSGGVAELEVYYTPEEKIDTTQAQSK